LAPERLGGALLLAAGLGTRLRPLTDVLPKCLVPIRGRPLLEYWLQALVTADIAPIVVNTHYHAELVEAYIAACPWSDRIVVSPERELLGTGGTLIANATRFSAGPVLVAHADNLSAFEPSAFLAAHAGRPAEAALTMMTFTTDVPESCGIVTTDARGLVDGFYEKVADPPGHHANGAVYIVEPEVVEFVRSFGRDTVDLSTEVLPHFVGRMATWHNATYHRDIGNLDAWRRAQREFPGPVPAPPADDPWARVLERLAPEARARIDVLLGGDEPC